MSRSGQVDVDTPRLVVPTEIRISFAQTSAMTIEGIQSICQQFKAVTEDIKWENHLCFNVGDKMFLVTAPDTVPATASFKVSDEEFDEVSSRAGFKPAPYMARYKWVYVDDISRLNKKEWAYFAKQAYTLTAAKLPAKTKKQLGL